jgi:hypothetical protein
LDSYSIVQIIIWNATILRRVEAAVRIGDERGACRTRSACVWSYVTGAPDHENRQQRCNSHAVHQDSIERAALQVRHLADVATRDHISKLILTVRAHDRERAAAMGDEVN